MPVQTTYPGIYIQELPSSTHTISAAPTSKTVFVGYTHPFKTKTFGKPIEIFGFGDYQKSFGGFFRCTLFDNPPSAIPNIPPSQCGDVAQAVNQFFLNGGADAYVIGLPAAQSSPTESSPGFPAATANIGQMVFTAREIVDADHTMSVTINNINPTSQSGSPLSFSFSQPFSSLADETCDVTISFGPPSTSPLAGYGYVTETYRQVSIFPQLNNKPNPNFIGTRIGTQNSPVSSLVTVSVPNPGPFLAGTYPLVYSSGLPTLVLPPGVAIFNSAQFRQVFQQYTPLDKLPIFNLVVIPGVTDFATLSAATAFCEKKRAFLIMDPPVQDSADGLDPPNSTAIGADFEAGIVPKNQNSAIYFPYLTTTDPRTGQVTNPFTLQPYEMPPSGTIAGIYASTDLTRGVWKAPAGLATTMLNVIDVVERGQMSDAQQGVLNLIGVNCVRDIGGAGPVVWGARTSKSEDPAFQQWKYVPVRRMALFLEQTLYANLAWVVFEPNAPPLWTTIVSSIQAFMLSLFRQNAFAGTTPSEAFQVKCDSQTTSQQDIDNGIVNILVAFAPLEPAEFVVIQIAQLAGQVQS